MWIFVHSLCCQYKFSKKYILKKSSVVTYLFLTVLKRRFDHRIFFPGKTYEKVNFPFNFSLEKSALKFVEQSRGKFVYI